MNQGGDFAVGLSSERVEIECRICRMTLSSPYTGLGLANTAVFKTQHQHADQSEEKP